MTRCAFENDADEPCEAEVNVYEPGSIYPGGAVTVSLRAPHERHHHGTLHRREAEVLLHLLAHKLDYTLVENRKAKLLPPVLKRLRRRRRPF